MVNSVDRWFRNYTFGAMINVHSVPKDRAFTNQEFSEIMKAVMFPHLTKIKAMELLFVLSKTSKKSLREDANKTIAELFNSINCKMFERS